MTKTQIWVAAFLAIFILLFLLGRLTKKEESGAPPVVENPMPQSNLSSQDLTPEELINRLGCTNCHGAGLEGTPLAPELKNISQNWSQNSLINYLRNPSSYMDSKRFKAYKEKYPGSIMPPFNNVEVKELGKIADYLLTK